MFFLLVVLFSIVLVSPLYLHLHWFIPVTSASASGSRLGAVTAASFMNATLIVVNLALILVMAPFQSL